MPTSARVSKELMYGLGPLVISSIIALSFLFYHFSGQGTAFDELALGPRTATVYGVLEGDPVHCLKFADADRCLVPGAEFSAESVTLWFGNSQLHGMNDHRAGQEASSTQLTRILRAAGRNAITFSQPNASLQEHYILLEALSERFRFDTLLLPIIFDDFREMKIRFDVLEAVLYPGVKDVLASSEIGRQLISEATGTDILIQPVDQTFSLQKNTEEWINTRLDDISEIWRTRDEARLSIYINLYNLRNLVFDINPSTKRPMLEGAFDRNWQALEAIIAVARRRGIRPVLYIAPLRPEDETLYIPHEYDSFKARLTAFASTQMVELYNLENLVPLEEWGYMGAVVTGEDQAIDFMHFRFEGHRRLAQELSQIILGR